MTSDIQKKVEAAYRGGRLCFPREAVSNHAIRYIASKQWPELITLCLTNKSVDDEGLDLLSRCKFEAMTALYLDKCHFTNAGLLSLGKAKWLNLTSLELSCNRLDSIGCKLVTRIQLPNLEQLFLNLCRIDSYGLQHLSKGKWPQMLKLNLDKNNLNKEGLACLPKLRVKRLKLLFISDTQISLNCLLLADTPKLETILGYFDNIAPPAPVLIEQEQVVRRGQDSLKKLRWRLEQKFANFQKANSTRLFLANQY